MQKAPHSHFHDPITNQQSLRRRSQAEHEGLEFNIEWVERMILGIQLRADAAVAIKGIHVRKVLCGQVEIRARQILNDAFLRDRFRDDNHAALSLHIHICYKQNQLGKCAMYVQTW